MAEALHGDDAQTFVDVVDEVRPILVWTLGLVRLRVSSLPHLLNRCPSPSAG